MSNSSRAQLSDPAIDLSKPILSLSDSEKAAIKKAKGRGNKAPAEEVLIKMKYLDDVENALKAKLQRPPSRREIIDQMRLIGFDITISTLWRLRGQLKTKQAWLSDLLQEGTFSAYQSDTMDLLDYIIEQSIKYTNKKWTASKTVTKEDPDGTITIIKTEAEDQATPKYNFLSILAQAVKLRKEMLTGTNLDLATAALEEEFDKAKDRITELESKNHTLNAELKSILGKHGKPNYSS